MKTKTALKSGSPSITQEMGEVSLRKNPEMSGGAGSLPGIKRVLVPIDFSPCSLRALDYAVVLAEGCHAKLILLHVVESARYSDEYFGASADENAPHIKAEREHLAETSRKRIGHRVASETLVRMGRPWSEIPDTAKALGVDLIVMGKHGSNPKKDTFGSTAEGVLRHAHCPVLTIRHAE
jgi:nucleotide-binding universal stress UspA family protein